MILMSSQQKFQFYGLKIAHCTLETFLQVKEELSIAWPKLGKYFWKF